MNTVDAEFLAHCPLLAQPVLGVGMLLTLADLQPKHLPPPKHVTLEYGRALCMFATQPAFVPKPAQPAFVPKPAQPAFVPKPTQPAFVPKPAQPAFVPKPTQPAFVPKPTQPAFVPKPLMQQVLKPSSIDPMMITGKKVYIFVDNSNIVYGAQKCHGRVEKGGHEYLPDQCLLDTNSFIHLISKGYDVIDTRIVIGSKMPKTVQQKWIANMFNVKIGGLSPDGKEVFVDEALHSCIAKPVLSAENVANPQILVICTGDGNENSKTNSFPSLATESARLGWYVVIWSWQRCLSPKFYDAMNKYPNNICICILDNYRNELFTTKKHS
jgi:hypothetical protein